MYNLNVYSFDLMVLDYNAYLKMQFKGERKKFSET